MRDHCVRIGGVGQSKPHGYGRQDTRFLDALVILLESERINILVGRPERLIESRLFLIEFRCELFTDITFAQQSSKIRKRFECLDPKPCLVVLILDREQRTAFNPAVANSGVLRESLRIVRRVKKLISAPDVIPLGARKIDVSALHCIIIHRDDEERGRIG